MSKLKTSSFIYSPNVTEYREQLAARRITVSVKPSGIYAGEENSGLTIPMATVY